jgi:hypothetical protein
MKTLTVELKKENIGIDINQEITDLYLYMDCNKKTFEPKYNDEIPLKINIEKLFIKHFSKQFNFQKKKIFDNLIDVIIQEGGKEKKEPKTPKENIYIIYEIKENFLK